MRWGCIAADELLRLPVRLHGIQLGRPVDVLLDAEAWRVVGLDVLCGDEVHRFLPLAAAELSAEEIGVRSAFLLLDDAELAYYREQGRSCASCAGSRSRTARPARACCATSSSRTTAPSAGCCSTRTAPSAGSAPTACAGRLARELP